MTFQYLNYELVDSHICDNDHPWRLAQLIFPAASVFIDVGANVGYVTAKLFGLWSPGTGFNRQKLNKLIEADFKLNKRSAKSNMDTVCGDGLMVDQPLLCHKQCSYRRSMSVYAFDGQTSHVHNTRRVVYEAFPFLHPNHTGGQSSSSLIHQRYEYINAAVTDTVPSATTMGFFKQTVDEGGKLVLLQQQTTNGTDSTNSTEGTHHSNSPTPRDSEIVIPVTTIDRFTEERGLAVVDILKIDAEGADQAVIRGASYTLKHRGVKMVTAEVDSILTDGWTQTVHMLDTEYGFDCYTNGVYNTFLRVTKCMDIERIKQGLVKAAASASTPPLAVCNEKNAEGEKCPEFIRFGGSKVRSDLYRLH